MIAVPEEWRAWSGRIREKLAGAGIVTLRSGDSWERPLGTLRNAEPERTRHRQPQKSEEREFGRD